MLPPRYDDAPPDDIHNHPLVQMAQDHQYLSSQNIYIHFLPVHRYKVWLHDKNLL